MVIDILHGTQSQILSGGNPTARPVSLVYGMRVPLTIALYHDDGQATPYSQAEMEQYAAWQFAVDEDYDHATPTAVLTSTGFVVAGNTVTFTAATNTDRFLAILAGGARKDGGGELKGYKSGETLPALVVQFPVRLQATRTGETAEPPVEQQPDFVTAAQAESIAAGKIDTHYPPTEKTTPAAADRITLWDSAAGLSRKYLSWTNLVAAVQTALATVYEPIGAATASLLAHTTAYNHANLLSSAEKAALTGGPESDADALHTHPALDGGGDVSALAARVGALEFDQAAAPAGATVPGKVYRRTADGWQTADPNDPECETRLLWIALGTNASVGMRAEGVVETGSWSGVPHKAVWMDENGGITETVPNEVSHAGLVARQIGWTENATSIRFCGKLQPVFYEGGVS